MKYFIIIIELLLVAATVGIAIADVPPIALWVAIGACALFGLFSLIYIIISICKEIKKARN